MQKRVNFQLAGKWGGGCLCPNGEEYLVGIVDQNGKNGECKGLACLGGIELNCTKSGGKWSNTQVSCGQGILQ